MRTFTPRFITIDGQITLRITGDGQIAMDIPVSAVTAAMMMADAALFLRDQIQKSTREQTNQHPKEQQSGTQT